MKYYPPRVWISLLICIFTQDLHAGGRGEGLCVLRAIHQAVSRSRAGNAWYDSALKSKLQRFHERLKVSKKPAGLPKTMTFKGGNYEVLEYLGSGFESDVYLVSKNGQLFALKKFKATVDPSSHAKNLQSWGDLGLPVATVLDQDLKEGALLMEYRAGPSYYEIWKRGEELGMSQRDIQKIRSAYKRFRKSVDTLVAAESRPSGNPFKDENLVFDIEKGLFYLVDPH